MTVGAGHTHALYVHEHTPLHRLPAQVKIVAALGMVVSVAVTPREAVWAFAGYAAAIAVLASIARVPAGFMAGRLLAVAPFVAFALLIPFVASGETIEIIGLDLSVPGLWGAWNVLAKAVLGASVTILLTATTEIADILRGLGALRVPAVVTSIAIFMIRYLELVADELRRMRVAMTARGYQPAWIHQVRPIGHAAGALFVRSYERGERVHDAMLSRGFTGAMPRTEISTPSAAQWLFGLIPVWFFVAVSIAAWWAR